MNNEAKSNFLDESSYRWQLTIAVLQMYRISTESWVAAPQFFSKVVPKFIVY